MALFGRRDKVAQDQSDATQQSGVQVDQVSDDIPVSVDSVEASKLRTQGPWDEFDDFPDAARVDLGGIRVPQSDRFKIQVQADQSTGAITLVSLITDDSAVQLQAYAAPRSGDMWSQVRGQISSQINAGGGLVEEAEGSFGVELRAQVTGQDGKAQPARFCGIEGPRWFLRLVFLGRAARDPQAAALLEAAVRDVVVVRGDQAMPMGNAIAMRMPVDPNATNPASGPPPQADRPTIALPERGPEITETR